MTIKHYVKSDGNGGVTINKNLVFFLTFILTILLAVVAYASRAGGINSDVENLKDAIEKNIEMHDELNKVTSDLRVDMETNIATTTTEIITIKDDISEIKDDIKLLLRKP